METISDMWSSSKVAVSLSMPKFSAKLDASKRKFITSYIKRHPIRRVEHKAFIGRLIGAELGADRKFRIDSTEGIYYVEVPDSGEVQLHNKIKDDMLKVVKISGKFEIGITKLKVEKIAALEIVEEKFTELIYGKKENEFVKLKKPVQIAMSYNAEKEVVVMENEELDIFAVEKTVFGAYISMKEQFDLLLDKYLYVDQKELSKDALELREKLHKIVHGG